MHIQVNLCQKLLFLHQLTHNMTTDCSIELQAQYMKIPSSNLGRTCCVQKLFPTSRIFLYTTCSAKRRASDKDLPVSGKSDTFMQKYLQLQNMFFLIFLFFLQIFQVFQQVYHHKIIFTLQQAKVRCPHPVLI